MPRHTLDGTLGHLHEFPSLRIRQVIRLTPGYDHGLLLTTRDDSPGTLGLGAVDRDGAATALGLNEGEVRQLRDALDAWLEEPDPPTVADLSRVAPDPWTDPDA